MADRERPGLTLAAGQFALMGVNLLFGLGVGYAGGLAAVGSVATAVLIFQLTCGVLQRTLAEATLLAAANPQAQADQIVCRWAVTAGLLGGGAGAMAAVVSTLAVPAANLSLAIAYAA